MIMDSLISIFLTNYNNSNIISKAIHSVLNQSYTNWELIIIDDKSTDNSIKVINNLIKNNTKIKLFQNKMNYGTYYSLNECLKKAKGDYFVKIDSDDFYHKDKLKEQLEFCIKNKLELCTCNVFRILGKRQVKENNDSSLFFSRKIFETFGYFDNFRFGCDSEYIQRIKKFKQKIFNLNKNLDFKYSIRHSLTNSNETGLKSSIGKKIRINYMSNSKKYNSKYINHPLFIRKKYMSHYFHRTPLEIELKGNYKILNQNDNEKIITLEIIDDIVLGRVIYKIQKNKQYKLYNPKQFKLNIKQLHSNKYILKTFNNTEIIEFCSSSNYISVEFIFNNGVVEYTPLLIEQL